MKTTVILGALLILGVQLAAQTSSTGAVAGVVTDPNQAMISGTQIVVTNEATGEVHTAQSQANGAYTVPLLPPGSYRVEFKKSGFRNTVKTGLAITVGETSRLDARLEIGAVQQEVTV